MHLDSIPAAIFGLGFTNRVNMVLTYNFKHHPSYILEIQFDKLVVHKLVVRNSNPSYILEIQFDKLVVHKLVVRNSKHVL
jgi:hypothetical protein